MQNTNRINIMIQEAKNVESQIDELSVKMGGSLPFDPDYHDELGRPTEKSLIAYDKLKYTLDGLHQRIGILVVAQTFGMQLVDDKWCEVQDAK